MKNYDEITNHLLKRRDQYTIEQKKKRKMIGRTAASMCCVCLVAMLGVGVWQSGLFESDPSVVTPGDFAIGGSHSADSNKYDSANNPVANYQIRIQKIEKLPDNSTEMMFALMVDDFIRMSHDEINEYYGVNIFPTVPSDLESKVDQTFGIYKRKANGEPYWDTNKISYANSDYSRDVTVNVDKDCMPFDFCNLFDNIQTRSIINNVEVGIAQTPIGELYAEFMYQNVGFRIFAYGLTQDEFVAIAASILE